MVNSSLTTRNWNTLVLSSVDTKLLSNVHSTTLYDRRYGWISICGGLIITFVFGAVYSWSVYIKPLIDELGFTYFEASLPFSVFIIVFATTSFLGAKIYERRGIKTAALLGVLSTALGTMLCSLVALKYISTFENPFYGNMFWLIFTYGVIAGLGSGFGYTPVIAMARKWFPDRAGLVTGVVIFGYGGGALAFAPVQTALIQLYGLHNTYLLVGILSLVMGLPAVFLVKDPPVEVTRYYATFSRRRAVLPKVDMETREVVRTIDFWLLFTSYLLVAGCGLLVIGHLAKIGAEKGLDPMTAAMLVSLFAIMNGLGRPPAGWISDMLGKYGRPITMGMLFTIQGFLFAALAYTSGPALYLVASASGFIYGSTLSLYAAVTGDFFGLKYLSSNYALVFIGWGVGGLLFPALGGYIRDITGSYELALFIASIATIIGGTVSLYLKKRLKLYLE